MPCLFEIEKRLTVVDYPGSNSLEHHADTFSICGAMSNLLIIVIPYTGDISKVIGDEIKLAFEVTSGAEATKMILCINQCGHKLPKAIDSELQDKEDPIEFLKQRFASRLNQYYTTKGHGRVNVCKNDIFFTDWLLDAETRGKYGISGVEDIKEEIKAYLMKQKIFDKKESELLEDCLSHNFPSRKD